MFKLSLFAIPRFFNQKFKNTFPVKHWIAAIHPLFLYLDLPLPTDVKRE